MPGRNPVVGLLLLLAPLVGLSAPAPPEPPSPDEKTLRDAGIPVDSDGLLNFFRGRTLEQADAKHIHDLIRQLGADDFDDRENAAQALRKVGVRAAPLLHAAMKDPDVEVARRAERCLADVGGVDLVTPTAAARLIARRAPDGAVPVLLAYLPFTGDAAVEEEVLAALLALTTPGKGDAVLDAALGDPEPVKRAAAAHVLARKGDKSQQAAVRKLLTDADAHVRWRAAVGLLTARDKTGVPALLALMTEGPSDLAWRAEEVLRRVAGDKAPPASPGDTPESRRRCRDAWAAWWKENGDALDLAHFAESERLLGFTLGVEYNTGRVWECNRDGSVRWEIRNLAGPMEAQMLPNGRVLIAECNAHSVTERDLQGVAQWEKKIDGEPTGCQRLPDGSTFVSTYVSAMEFAPDGTKTFSFPIEGGSNAIRKMRNGHVGYAQADKIVEVDTTGKRVRTIPLPEGMWVGIEDLPGDRFLVANSASGRVLEVDVGGAILWEAKTPGACGVSRLPDGHTLVATSQKVVELDADGKVVWDRAVDGYVRRAHRR
jgi:hypothetical protein